MQKSNRFNIIVCISALSVFVILSAFFFFSRFNVILNGQAVVTVKMGENYSEQGCKAYFGAIPIKDVKIEDNINTSVPGEYTVTYTAHYGEKKATKTRTVRVIDMTAPVITAPETVDVCIGANPDISAVSFSALDNLDGNITNRVSYSITDDNIVLSVCDSYGNKAQKQIAVNRVKDTVFPTLTLAGNQSLFLKLGETFTESGFKALDNIDGDITSKVTVENTFDPSKTGTYLVSYSVTDSSSNTTVINRYINLYDPNKATTPSADGSKVIYLTFDDGPCVYTSEILDVLAHYNVKATFFVTNQKPDYQHLISRIHNEGHAIGVHTYSHLYSVYQNDETFFADIQAMNDIIAVQTGSPTRLLRFPGGSSNTISKQYNQGIMSRLAKSVTDMGYVYFDWNVTSGDASGSYASRNPQKIASNVIAGLKENSSIVLMHDMNGANIQSLPIIIEYALANGYSFAPLNENSPTAHHGINN